jgi:hypothetical protein
MITPCAINEMLVMDLKTKELSKQRGTSAYPVDATPSETIDWRSKDKISWTVYKLSLKK